MSSTQFDEMTKALATSTSRRQALKIFAASAVGGLAALAGGIGTSFAFSCPPGHGLVKCSPSGPCCTSLSECCGSSCCTSSQSCCGGTVCCDTSTQKCCSTKRGNVCCTLTQNCTPAGCTGK